MHAHARQDNKQLPLMDHLDTPVTQAHPSLLLHPDLALAISELMTPIQRGTEETVQMNRYLN